MKNFIFDGKANIALEQFPPEAWINLSPTSTVANNSRDDVLATQGYYETVAWLYRCVELRANGISRIPWAIMRGNQEIWHSRDSGKPENLAYIHHLKRLIWLTEACLCLAPEAFWFRSRNRVRTLDVRWIAPLSTVPVWDEQDGLIGFDRSIGGQTRRFGIDDIVYIPRPNPLHETMPGRPPAQAAMSAAGVVYSVDAFAAGFFDRGAIKATLLTVEGNPSETELRKLEIWWKRFFAGVKSAWESAAVRMGVKPVTIGEGIQELGNAELTKEKKEDIATGLGIPHSLVFSNAANFATAEQDAFNFYDLTLVPEMSIIIDAINQQLFEPQGLMLQQRPEELSVFQADENERGVSLKNYVEAGVPLAVAAEILGINLPEGMEYAELTQQGRPQFEVVETPPAQLIDAQAIAQEKSRFRRWASKRKHPDPDDFETDLLTIDDKQSILYTLQVGGKAALQAASFPGYEYP